MITSRLLIANHMLLMLCASMYLGTGGSLVLFSFPVAPLLTPDNYYLQLVPQIASATAFFTVMTKVMIATCLVMVAAEWRGDRWAAILMLVAIISATGVELKWIFPLSERMAQHITDPAELRQVLGEWMRLNRFRLALWSVQWLAMAWYFARWSRRGRYSALTR
ncbi:MAG: hypothetical protein JWR40_3135 [Massilia sp.]|jgi:Na+-driven multidrug efflux pump|nr:hypothetical protein [Massilia sp.]MDB5952866.1 hypothetical protein [Massilia sp.]